MHHRPPRVALRVLAVLAVWTASSLWLSIASAHHDITFSECPSEEEPAEPTPTPTATPAPAPTPEGPEPCTPPSGEVVRGELTLGFSVDADTFRPIREVHAFLDSEGEDIEGPGEVVLDCEPPDQIPESDGCQYEDDAPSDGTYSFVWDTNALTPYNGAFTFRVNARSTPHAPDPEDEEPEVTEAQRAQLLVDNPPVQPSRPRIVVTTENSVTVEWDPAPEPDLLAYTVYRAVTEDKDTKPKADDFEAIGQTTKAATRDEVDTAAAYWYRVRSTRRSVVTPDEGISSPLSPISEAGVVAGLRATPRPEGEPELTPPPRRPIVVPSAPGRPPPVPDAPFSAYLPFDTSNLATPAPTVEDDFAEPGGTDPRGPVLPVAVGAFLVTSALAVGRMPF